MFKKIALFFVALIFSVGIILTINTCSFLMNFENNMLITVDEIEKLNNQSINKINLTTISSVSNDNNTQSVKQSTIEIKLFNLINVASFNVYMPTNQYVVCGNTIGVLMNTDGVNVVGFSGVTSVTGIVYPFKNTNLKVGDRIKTINNKIISCLDDIDFAINSEKVSHAVEYTAMRDNEIISGTVTPVFDITAKMNKLGLWIREDTSGIGTLTFINPNTNRFGSLGHGICENGSEYPMKIKSGTIHNCEVVGVNKGEKGKTGEIKGLFVPNNNCEGVIDKNNEYGIYGFINSGSKYITGNKIDIGGRNSIKPGRAKILCCLDGESVNAYDIEIVKTYKQSSSNPKSLVIRVTDSKLLEITGGIIQGMSGSPIIQNNKLVGAVTHVFVNDPTKGFGVYMDWMINE